MDIRDAILAAAAHIEANPKQFNFDRIEVPNGCGTAGCALGWICFYSGIPAGDAMWYERIPGFRISRAGVFYDRMDELVSSKWQVDHKLCAQGMRLYADKYHPAPRFPDWNAMAASQTVGADEPADAVRAS